MRLESISARNFLTFGPSGVEFEPRRDLTTVVGPNDAGKTNLFRAVEFVIDALQRPQDVTAVRHGGRGPAEPFVRVRVTLTSEETTNLGRFFVLSAWNRNFNPAAGTGFETDTDNAEATRLSDRFIEKLEPALKKLFAGRVSFCVEGTGDATSPTEAWVEVETSKGPLFLRTNWGLTYSPARPLLSATPVDLRNETLRVAVGMFKDSLKVGTKAKRLTEANLNEVSQRLSLDWFLGLLAAPRPTPSILQLDPLDIRAGLGRLAGHPEIAEALFASLRTRGWYETAIGLRELLALILRTSIVRLSNWRAPPLDSPPPEFHEIPTHYGLVTGAELPVALWRLRDSSDLADRERFEVIRKAFEEFTKGERLDVVLETRPLPREEPVSSVIVSENRLVVAPPRVTLAYYQMPALRFRSGNLEVAVENLSAGKYEVLLVLFAALGNAGSVVFLDEPATNLHPSRQRDLVDLLVEKSKQFGIQLVIVTHSPWFVSPRHLEGLVRAENQLSTTRIHYLVSKNASPSVRFVTDVTRFPAIIRLLFARKVILFEGATEAAALPIWFGNLSRGLDQSVFEIDSDTVGGDGTFKRYAPTLKRLGVDFRVVGDQKGRPRLRGFLKRAILFPQQDFSDVIVTECPVEYQAALRQLRPRNGKKSPELCRLVARLTGPPPSVKQVWARVEAFLK